jgi:hypothetical protein
MGKIRIILLICLICSFSRLTAQEFSLTLIRTEKLTYETRDLWNLIIQNASQTTPAVYLQAYITEVKNGRVFEVRSADFILDNGTTQFNTSNYSVLLPEQVLFQKQNFRDHVIRTSSFPNGEYEICVYLFDSKTTQILAKDCYDILQLGTTPPYLVAPYDQDTVRETFPFFIWSPPAPQPANTQVTYTLSIFEIYKQQTYISAAQTNPAWQRAENLNTPLFQYGIDLRQFIPGNRYSWYVTAYINGLEASQSEIWQFIYQPEEEPAEEEATTKKKRRPDVIYYQLADNPNKEWYFSNKDELNFIFVNQNAINKVPYRIIDYQGNLIKYDRLDVGYGYNFISLDLSEIKDLKKDGYFILEIKAVTNPKKYLTFRYLPKTK